MEVKIGGWLINKRARASTAKVALPLPINGGHYNPDSSKEEAAPFVRWPIDYVAQKHVNMCGDACVNMLYAFHGDTPPNDMRTNPRGVVEGMDWSEMRQQFNRLARFRPLWLTNGRQPSNMNIAHALVTCGPLAVSGNFARFLGTRWGHWILLHGIMDTVLLIADPWHGEDRRKPFDWFLKHWDPGIGLIYYHKG